jgi:hypothetical protein
MNTATEALVIINSLVLVVFLSLGIVALVRLNGLYKKIEIITDKMNNFAESAEKFGSSLEKIGTAATYTNVIKNFFSSIINKKEG